jgi:dephospho-CoA kinase
MKVIGLTGGIGSGKSTVSTFLKELGAEVCDLDKTGHEILKKNGDAYQQVLSAFGDTILDDEKEIDRGKLGKIVFNNPQALKKLNSITHPAIDRKIEHCIEQAKEQGVKVMVMEAAAMLEAGRAWQADEVWVVTAPEDAMIHRIKDRPGYDEEVARSRIRSQMSNGERLKKADIVIENDGTAKDLKKKVKAAWLRLKKRM